MTQNINELKNELNDLISRREKLNSKIDSIKSKIFDNTFIRFFDGDIIRIIDHRYAHRDYGSIKSIRILNSFINDNCDVFYNVVCEYFIPDIDWQDDDISKIDLYYDCLNLPHDIVMSENELENIILNDNYIEYTRYDGKILKNYY